MPIDEELGRYQAIRKAKDRKDTDYLIRALVDPDHRAQAATFLGQLQAREATPGLLRLLDANDPHVRIAAARSLGWIGAGEARARLREIALHDGEAVVRSWAVGVLGDIQHADDFDLLVSFLEDPSLRVRGTAALKLGELGDPRAIAPLRRARRRLRRSPLEWYWHRKLYNEAIANLTRGPRDERDSDRAPWATGIALLGVYFVLRYFAGFWWAIVLTVAAALVLAVFRVVGAITREETSPPPQLPPPPE